MLEKDHDRAIAITCSLSSYNFAPKLGPLSSMDIEFRGEYAIFRALQP
jgi:hypothetical protein